MYQYHPLKMRLGNSCRAAGNHIFLICARNSQLDDAAEANHDKQRQIRYARYVHWSSIISALKPGPNAVSRPYSPADIFPFVIHSCRT